MYILTPYALAPQPCVIVEDVFTHGELIDLEGRAMQAEKVGEVGGADSIRRSHVTFVQDDWVLQKLAHAISRANAEHWRFDLTCFGEAIQLARYTAEELGHYDWHQDIGGFYVSRKLSVTVQLADEKAYEGGDLEIFAAATQVIKVGRKRGLCAIFPSYQLHRVTPVTLGTRCSLVAWVSGPSFR